MLVLSRRRDEVIMIGGDDSLVEITVVDIRGDKVRLGINAPHEIPVHRKEVYEKIKREKQQNATDLTYNFVADKQPDTVVHPGDSIDVTVVEQQAASTVCCCALDHFCKLLVYGKYRTCRGHTEDLFRKRRMCIREFPAAGLLCGKDCAPGSDKCAPCGIGLTVMQKVDQ